jgi:hypothetical protein
VAKEIYYRSWCDYPGCREEHEDEPRGQETVAVDYLFYVRGRGRKTQTVTVEMCEEHAEELAALHRHLVRFNQKEQ